MIKNITDLWNKYWEWLWDLDILPGLPIFVATIMIPVILLIQLITFSLGTYHKGNCLNSSYNRRWEENSWVCEEYVEDKWVEINQFEKGFIYHYNKTKREIIE